MFDRDFEAKMEAVKKPISDITAADLIAAADLSGLCKFSRAVPTNYGAFVWPDDITLPGLYFRLPPKSPVFSVGMRNGQGVPNIDRIINFIQEKYRI